jgi:hypothetical protein
MRQPTNKGCVRETGTAFLVLAFLSPDPYPVENPIHGLLEPKLIQNQ